MDVGILKSFLVVFTVIFKVIASEMLIVLVEKIADLLVFCVLIVFWVELKEIIHY